MKKHCKGRLILSPASNGPGNMAIDEAIFVATGNKDSGPTLRLYSWTEPCITIGYFQSYAPFADKGSKVTRRLTGGLAVNHHKDLSYSFCATGMSWPQIYDQMKTYEALHSIIKRSLEHIGFNTGFYSHSSGDKKTSICTESIFPYDLNDGEKKVLGSCQRRRGNTILVQGSIHSALAAENINQFAEEARNLFLKYHGIDLELSQPTKEELSDKIRIEKEKYLNFDWNNSR